MLALLETIEAGGSGKPVEGNKRIEGWLPPNNLVNRYGNTGAIQRPYLADQHSAPPKTE